MLARLQAAAAQRYVPPSFLASIHCALGDNASALDALERALSARDVYLPFLGLCSLRLQGEPRMERLQRRLQLAPPRDRFCAPLQAPAVPCRR